MWIRKGYTLSAYYLLAFTVEATVHFPSYTTSNFSQHLFTRTGEVVVASVRPTITARNVMAMAVTAITEMVAAVAGILRIYKSRSRSAVKHNNVQHTKCTGWWIVRGKLVRLAVDIERVLRFTVGYCLVLSRE